jgi:hypothetical protein
METAVFHGPGKVLSLVGQGRRLFMAYHGAATVFGDNRPQVL